MECPRKHIQDKLIHDSPSCPFMQEAAVLLQIK